MTLDHYIQELDKSLFLGTGQQQKITEILAQAEKDKKLSDDDRLAIETHARKITTSLPSEKSSESAKQRKPSRIFPKYDFGDAIVFPDGLREHGFDETCDSIAHSYAKWLLDVYLPTFHPMPNEVHQHPIAACLMLLNCNAVLSGKQCIPIPFFLGRNGSGKTELAKSIAQHYPKMLWTEIRPNNTGASIRDNLDSLFGSGEPGFALFDNFNPKFALDRWGGHYDIILANCKESSISRISSKSNDDNKSEFYTYCYKAFTSIFDIGLQHQEEFGEIARRCIVLRFKESKPKASRTIYDWDGQQRVFQRIWGDESMKEVQNVYGKALGQLVKMNPINVPISPKVWVICQVPIAVGVYAGIFANVNEGIAHFARHFEWLKQNTNNAVGSALSIILTKYIKEELPTLAAASQKNPYVPANKKISIDVMTQEQLCQYLQQTCGYAVGKKDFDELIALMSNFGYNYDRVGDKMGFIKEVIPSA